MGWIIAIVIGYFLVKGLSSSSNSTYSPPKYSPPQVRNVREEYIEIAKPKPKKRLVKYDDSLPENLIIDEEFSQAFHLMNNTNESVFITGKAGTGKSTLLKYFKLKTSKNIVILAPTGIAALQVNGQTIHSFFRFPPELIRPNTIHFSDERSQLLKNVDTIIIDEISMVRADLMDGIDKSLRVNRENENPFGGVQMIFFGDLFQLPPVVVGELNHYFTDNFGSPYFFSANVFNNKKFGNIELQTVHRQKDDLHFIDILNNIRRGNTSNQILSDLNKRVVPGFLPQRDDLFISLCTTNAVARNENLRRLNGLDSETFYYRAAITGKFDTKSAPTDETLELKVGCQVMMLKNDSDKRYVNGSIGKVKKLTDNKIVVEVHGSTVELEKAEWEQVEYKYDRETKKVEPLVVGTFTQYPIKLAWAITIHKSQGQTFEQVVIDLGRGAFAHGQTYVALSRCTSLNGIILKQDVRWNDIIVDDRVVQFMNN